MAFWQKIRTGLDLTYRYGGYIAAAFLVFILCFVTLQILARWSGEIIAGAHEFTGYSMAAASFLALPYALNAGTHIRVNLLMNALGRYRRFGEIWCWLVASALTSIFAYFAVKRVLVSYRINDISQGPDAWPIWIPQMSMALGTIVLAICAIDNLISILFTGKDNIKSIGVDLQAE